METVEKNKEYTLKIESVSSDGSGVGHIDGLTVFVPQTAPNDTVRAVITEVRKSYARARLAEVIAPSEDRQDADCPYYALCGGCQLRHIKYEKQLEIKKAIVENAMRRIGGFDNFHAEEIIGADNPSRYRNKMIFPVGKTDGQTVCGFYAPKSHDIIPLGDCALGDELNTQIINTVLKYMKDNNIEPYDEKTGTGVVRRIFTRKSFSTGEVMTVISANADNLTNREQLVKRLCSVSGKIVSVILNVNTGRLTLGNKNITLWGKEVICDTLCGVNFEISPNSFFQVNPRQTEKLYQKAIEFARLDNNTRVMDIYCGIGTISLCCAKTAKSVIGVEIVKQAIKNARENAIRNRIFNAEFYADSAENIVPRLITQGEQADAVILDPPRSGSDEKTLTAIIKSDAERIVYVSCNPATLARDTKLLAQNGYKLTRSAVFDMFPHTCHVETVVLMERQ